MDNNQDQIPQENAVYDEPAGPPIKKIISLAVGALVVLFIIALIIFFVLPMFRSSEPEDATLTYWGIWEDKAIMDEIIADFTRENPNIKVVYEKQDIKGIGSYIDRLFTRSDSGEGPDIFRYHNSWVRQLQPLLLPLPQTVVEATGLEENFFPVVNRDLNMGGAYYGIPIHFDTLALFINTELFADAGISEYPETWNELISVSRQLTVKNEAEGIRTAGVALGTYDNIAHASDIISHLLLLNGADLYNLNGEGTLRESSVDALNFYVSFAQGESNVWDASMENSKLAFAGGNLAMYFGYSWDIFEIQAMNPSLEFVITSVPRSASRSNTIASYWVEGVSAKSKHPSASFKFLEYLAQRSTIEKLYEKQSQVRLFGSLYPRKDMTNLLQGNSLIYPFVAQGEIASSTFFSSDTYDEAMVDTLNSYLGNAIRSMTENNTSAQSAVGTLANGVAQVFSRYGQQTSN